MTERLPANEQPRSLARPMPRELAWTAGWSVASLIGAGGFAALQSAGLLAIGGAAWPWLLMLPSGVLLALASLRYERHDHRIDAPIISLTWGGCAILLLSLAFLIPLNWALVGAMLAASGGALLLIERGVLRLPSPR